MVGEKQHTVSAYLGQAIFGWGNVTEQAALNLFNGEDATLSTLTKLLAKGHMIGTAKEDDPAPDLLTQTQLQQIMLRSFYAYAIPVAWQLSGRSPVFLDTGSGCATDPDSFGWFDNGQASQAKACFDGKLYLLGWPKGQAAYDGGSCDNCGGNPLPSHFTIMPGMDALADKDNAFGHITMEDMISGYVCLLY